MNVNRRIKVAREHQTPAHTESSHGTPLGAHISISLSFVEFLRLNMFYSFNFFFFSLFFCVFCFVRAFSFRVDSHHTTSDHWVSVVQTVRECAFVSVCESVSRHSSVVVQRLFVLFTSLFRWSGARCRRIDLYMLFSLSATRRYSIILLLLLLHLSLNIIVSNSLFIRFVFVSLNMLYESARVGSRLIGGAADNNGSRTGRDGEERRPKMYVRAANVNECGGSEWTARHSRPKR